jgi:uncharacterized protein YoaH (UPF0181 family)
MTKRKHPPKPRKPGDYDPELIWAFKHFTRHTFDSDGTEAADGKWVMLPKTMADDILVTLERAKKPERGYPPKSEREKHADEWVVARARMRKQKLVAGGMSPGKAIEQAAKEFAKRSKLSLTHIRDAIPRRPKRPTPIR